MDERVIKFLIDCELTEYIPTFKNYEIDHNRLLNIPESLINEIFDKVYPRHVFTDNLRKIRVGPEGEKADFSFLNGRMQGALKFGPKNSVKEILQKTTIGRLMMDKTELNKTDRKNIVELVIEHYINIGVNLSVSDFMILAKEIKQVFPTEDETTYFQACGNGGEKRKGGKLYDKFFNKKRSIRVQYQNKELPQFLKSSHKGSNSTKESNSISNPIETSLNTEETKKRKTDTSSINPNNDTNCSSEYSTSIADASNYFPQFIPHAVPLEHTDPLSSNKTIDLVKENDFLKMSLESEREISENLQTQVVNYQKYIRILKNRIKDLNDGGGARYVNNDESYAQTSVEQQNNLSFDEIFVKEESDQQL